MSSIASELGGGEAYVYNTPRRSDFNSNDHGNQFVILSVCSWRLPRDLVMSKSRIKSVGKGNAV
jgi:hypothetical protein